MRRACGFADEYKVRHYYMKQRLEFQMLMGVRDELKRKLVKRGFTVVDYIPYGKNWFPYTTRRIRERKRNILLIMRSVFDI